jgi:hypothetical protein
LLSLSFVGPTKRTIAGHDLWNAAGFDKKDAYARLRIAVKGTKWASCSPKKLRNLAKSLRAQKQQGERTAVTAKARTAAKAKAKAGDPADYDAIVAADKKRNDAGRDANGDLLRVGEKTVRMGKKR